MKQIHKHRITPGINILETQADARVLLVAQQDGMITVWVETDLSRLPSPPLVLRVLPTGGGVTDGVEHVGSLVTKDDAFVFHVYRDVMVLPPAG